MALPDNVTCPGVFCQYQVNCAGSVNVTTRNLLRFNVHKWSCGPNAARVRDGSSHSYNRYTIKARFAHGLVKVGLPVERQ